MDALTDAQQEAVRLLVMGERVKDIAEALSIDRSTLYHWRNSPEFKAELQARQREATENAVSMARSHSSQAMAVLVDMLDPEAKIRPELRRQAAIDILDRSGVSARNVLALEGGDKPVETVELSDIVHAMGGWTPEQIAALAGDLSAVDDEA